MIAIVARQPEKMGAGVMAMDDIIIYTSARQLDDIGRERVQAQLSSAFPHNVTVVLGPGETLHTISGRELASVRKRVSFRAKLQASGRL